MRSHQHERRRVRSAEARVHGRTWFAIEPALARVTDDADDTGRTAAGADVQADGGWRVGKEAADEGAVDERFARTAGRRLAAKAAIEQWVRCVRAEREDRGTGPWVVAIRPGFVDTPAARREAELPPDTHPGVPGIAEAVRTGNMLDADESAALIWGSLPDAAKAKAVLLFGEPVGVTTE